MTSEMLNLFLQPLDQVHSLRRRAEYEWSKRNFEEANRLYERALDCIKIIVSLDEVQKDRNLRRSLLCQMADLIQNVRHSSNYATRALRKRSVEISLESPVVVDSSTSQDGLLRKFPFNFTNDTLLQSRMPPEERRSGEEFRIQAKKRDRKMAEIVEERKMACLQKKRILEFEIASLRENRQRLSLLRSERDILLDRKGIREDKFTFGSSLRRPRRSSEEEVEEERWPGLNDKPEIHTRHSLRKVMDCWLGDALNAKTRRGDITDTCVTTSVPEGYSLCLPLASPDYTLCSFVERQMKTDREGDMMHGPDLTISEQAQQLDEELAKLRGHLEVVNSDNGLIMQEIAEVKAAIAVLREELEIPEDPIRQSNAHESESDTESNSLLPLSVPPAFSVPHSCLSDGLELLDDSDDSIS